MTLSETIAAILVALLGGGGLVALYLARSQRKSNEAQAAKTMADAGAVKVGSDVSVGTLIMAFAERLEVRLKYLETEYELLKTRHLNAIDDVREAIAERHKCEEELAQVKERLDEVERKQRELPHRVAASLEPVRHLSIEELLWPSPPELPASEPSSEESK